MAPPAFLPYPASDLSEREWAILALLLPPPKPGGRPRTVDLRRIVDGILHVLRSGGQWRLLPHDYGPWSTVYGYLRASRLDGTWERLHTVLRERLRQAVGRHATPSAAILDSQSVKTTERGGPHGDDGAKQLSGRKRHLLVDTLGLVLRVVVHPAAIQDRAGAPRLLLPLASALPRLELIWAESAYVGPLQTWVWQTFGWRLAIVEGPGGRGGWMRAGQESPLPLPDFQLDGSSGCHARLRLLRRLHIDDQRSGGAACDDQHERLVAQRLLLMDGAGGHSQEVARTDLRALAATRPPTRTALVRSPHRCRSHSCHDGASPKRPRAAWSQGPSKAEVPMPLPPARSLSHGACSWSAPSPCCALPGG